MSPSGELLLERLGLHPSQGGNSPGSSYVRLYHELSSMHRWNCLSDILTGSTATLSMQTRCTVSFQSVKVIIVQVSQKHHHS